MTPDFPLNVKVNQKKVELPQFSSLYPFAKVSTSTPGESSRHDGYVDFVPKVDDCINMKIDTKIEETKIESMVEMEATNVSSVDGIDDDDNDGLTIAF